MSGAESERKEEGSSGVGVWGSGYLLACFFFFSSPTLRATTGTLDCSRGVQRERIGRRGRRRREAGRRVQSVAAQLSKLDGTLVQRWLLGCF